MRMYRSKLITVESKFRRSPLITLEQDQTTDALAAQPAPEPDPTAAPPDEQAQESPTPEAEADLKIQIQRLSETSPDFDAQIQKGLATISEDIRSLLSDAGFVVGTVNLISDVMSDDPNQPTGIPWSYAASATLFEQKQVVIAESSLDSNGSAAPGLNVEGLLRMGVGHVLNSMAPQFVDDKDQLLFSNLESFKYAHTSDVARLAADKKQKLAFYIDDGDAARGECFAECFAAMTGGGAVYTLDVMSKYFPAVVKQMKDILNAIKSGSKMSGQPEQKVETPAPETSQAQPPASNVNPDSLGA